MFTTSSMGLRLLAAGGVVAATLAVGATTAAAQETNYCTAVPDSGPYFNFNDACRVHDDCYLNQPYGGGDAGRAACDGEFLGNMGAACGEQFGGGGGVLHCINTAETYYWGVDTFGGWFWDDLPEGTVIVGDPIPVTETPPPPPPEPEGTVTVGPIEIIEEPEAPAYEGGGGESGGAGAGGGWDSGGGFDAGWSDVPVGYVDSFGGGSSSGGTVTVGDLEVVYMSE